MTDAEAVEIFTFFTNGGRVAIISWARDGKGKSWKHMGSVFPCPKGPQYEAEGWEWEMVFEGNEVRHVDRARFRLKE